MDELMLMLAQKYPAALSILGAIGLLRVINKPLFAVARSIVEFTSSKSDDAALDAVEQSKAYKGFCFLLDWLTSIKLQPPKQEMPKILEPAKPEEFK